jgi:Holliday junction resolvase RusA-like endonuclease
LWREREYYQAKIKEQYDGPVVKGAIIAEYVFCIAIPKSCSKKKRAMMMEGEDRPTKRPDRDNMAKFLSDCLQGIVFEDDSQIVDGPIRKYYDETGKTIIKISIL